MKKVLRALILVPAALFFLFLLTLILLVLTAPGNWAEARAYVEEHRQTLEETAHAEP